jgi:hypothetical protein
MAWLTWAAIMIVFGWLYMYLARQTWKSAGRKNEIAFYFGCTLIYFLGAGLIFALIWHHQTFPEPLPPLSCPGDSINAKDYWGQEVCL